MGTGIIWDVLVFGCINSLFELVLLSMLSPRKRLRLLGNEGACAAIHVFFLFANLTIHWGTVVGTMTASTSFITSLATITFAKHLFGKIVDGRYYTVGILKYNRSEIT